MLDMIRALQGRPGLSAASGDINYSVRKFPGYGKLSGKTLDELRAESASKPIRASTTARLRLWKRAKEGSPPGRRPGRGPPRCISNARHGERVAGRAFRHSWRRPGLAVPPSRERNRPVGGCARRYFRELLDAQRFVRVDDEKMSKSLGNFFTIREVLKQYDAEVVRFSSCARITAARSTTPTNIWMTQRRSDAPVHGAQNVPPQAAAIDWNDALRRPFQGGNGRRFQHTGGHGCAVRACS